MTAEGISSAAFSVVDTYGSLGDSWMSVKELGLLEIGKVILVQHYTLSLGRDSSLVLDFLNVRK